MRESEQVVIRPAKISEAGLVAEIQGEGLNSRLNALGPWFCTFLHRHMITSRHCSCLVAETEREIVGCAIAFASTKKFYREFILKKGILAGLMILPWLFRPGNFRTVLNVATYSNRADNADPEAEWVIMVVKPEARGQGIANVLHQGIVDSLRANGVSVFKVCTPTDNIVANAMYVKASYELVRSEPFSRDVVVNVYYCPI